MTGDLDMSVIEENAQYGAHINFQGRLELAPDVEPPAKVKPDVVDTDACPGAKKTDTSEVADQTDAEEEPKVQCSSPSHHWPSDTPEESWPSDVWNRLNNFALRGLF